MTAPSLIVTMYSRPWWLLGLVTRRTTLSMQPPPDATFADVMEIAERLRASGASVDVVQ